MRTRKVRSLPRPAMWTLLGMLATGLSPAGGPSAAGAENFAKGRPVRASSVHAGTEPELAVDGRVADDSRWLSAGGPAAPHWLEIEFDAPVELGSAHLYSGWRNQDAIADFDLQAWSAGQWQTIDGASVRGNEATARAVPFTQSVRTDRVRLKVYDRSHARVRELALFGPHPEGTPPLETAVDVAGRVRTLPPIYLNQSGFDPDRPKRFTMPSAADGTPFTVQRVGDGTVVFQGTVEGRIGDFSEFRPDDPSPQYVVEAAGHRSVPFGIGPYWVERVTYQPAMDFMVQSRHYVGDVTGTRRLSYAWRDDHHFAFTAQTLAAQYLANPSAYDRMPRQVQYVPPNGRNAWGALEPYADDAPDIVKLLHWNADVIVTRRLTHAMKKAQLAAFLYAYPYMSDHVPESAYDQVLALALELWEQETADHRYPYDETPREGHNMLALDTTIGSTKGSHPPAHSILPNLYMYEVARRENLDDAEAFFDAAYRQAQWVIEHLDWHDPQTTKGQRQGEHATMTGLVMFAMAYPDRAPAGLRDKLRQWARVAVGRSDNMWDFRRLSEDQWVPSGAARTAWNEPGNVAGFAACALGVAMVIDDAELRSALERLAFAHMDNVFGRNPTGRHFSHRAPGELEGVEYGWYSYHKGGIGALDRVTFVLDGAPKNEHYPYHPEIGDVGWTEGWVNFNTAYNMSLAMMAAYETKLELLDAGTNRPLETVQPGQRVLVRLRAPLNFDYRRVEQARVQVHGAAGQPSDLTLDEDGPNSRYFQGTLPVPADAKPGDAVAVSYGFGWLAARAEVTVGNAVKP